MSPARAGGTIIDLHHMVRRIALEANLFRWFATNGRRVAALSAIAAARHDATTDEARVLDFLEQLVG